MAAKDHPRRILATACITATTSAFLVVPAAQAHAAPKPTAAEIRKKLTKLNEQVDKLVDRYNQTREDLKTAQKKYAAAQRAAQAEQADFEKTRQQAAQLAAAAYKSGDMSGVPSFLSAGNPQSVLDQVAVMTQLSRDRSSQISLFLNSAQRLQREQSQAQGALNDVSAKAKSLKAQKTALDKQINEQKKLLRKIGGGSSGGGGGGSYTGPATGSARKAIQFAFAQLGKPYGYGDEGPNSYDCSGLTMKAWAAAGVGITRTTNTQYAATRRVSYEDLQPGDLVFFSNLGHVGLYIGGGVMIHAPHTGDVVKKSNITSGYYRQNFYGGGRP